MPPSGELNQKWPTSGPGGYITPATWGPLQSGGQNQQWLSEVETSYFFLVTFFSQKYFFTSSKINYLLTRGDVSSILYATPPVEVGRRPQGGGGGHWRGGFKEGRWGRGLGVS